MEEVGDGGPCDYSRSGGEDEEGAFREVEECFAAGRESHGGHAAFMFAATHAARYSSAHALACSMASVKS